MKKTFKKLIVNFQERTFGKIVARDYEIPTTTKKFVNMGTLISVNKYNVPIYIS